MEKIKERVSVIKYGTNVLTRTNSLDDDCIDFNVIKDHGSFINNGIQGPVIMVSSGAVGFGFIIDKMRHISDLVIRKRALASMGNLRLFTTWAQSIPDKNLLQALVTHRDMKNETSRNNIKKLIWEVYQKPGSIIIFNDNDFVSDEELIQVRGGEFGDNDYLAALITELCLDIFEDAELIINTSSNGVLDENEQRIKQINASEIQLQEIDNLCSNDRTQFGTGGMKDKLTILSDLVRRNPSLVCYIINGKDVSNLRDVGSEYCQGTEIVY